MNKMISVALNRMTAVALLAGLMPAVLQAADQLKGSAATAVVAACGQNPGRPQSVSAGAGAVSETELFDLAVMDHLARYATAGAFVAYAASRQEEPATITEDRHGKFIRVGCRNGAAAEGRLVFQGH